MLNSQMWCAVEEHALRFKVISKVGNGVYALRESVRGRNVAVLVRVS
jgi:hypothetical protein